MATKTKSERTYKKATGSLPPLVVLEVGNSLEGQIQSVDVVKTEILKKGKKPEIKERVFYRIRLEADCEAMDKDKKKVLFQKDQVVTLPGSGGLDYTFSTIALEIEKKTNDEQANLQVLKGIYIQVSRIPDGKMKKGTWAGKDVKNYDVSWSVDEA